MTPGSRLAHRVRRLATSPVARRIWFTLGALLVIALWLNMVRRALQGAGSQYDDFVAFSRDLLYRRLNVYAEYDPAITSITKYPPAFALLFAPLVLLPTPAGASLWFFLSLFLAAASAVAARRAVETVPSPARGGPVFWIPFLLAAGITGSNLETAQVNILVLYLVCLALVAFRRGREGRAGVLLGVVTALKLTPGLFILYFAWKRAWRVVLGAAGGLVASWVVAPLLLMGPRYWLAVMEGWLADLLPFLTRGTMAEGIAGFRHTNQSLGAVVFRFLTETPAGAGREGYYVNFASLDPEAAGVVVRAASAAILVALAVLTRPSLGERGALARGLEWALVLIATLFLSPIAWINHYVALLFPFVVCAVFLEEMPAGRSGRRGVLASLVLAGALLNSSVSRLAQAWSLPFLGALVLLTASALALRGGAVARESPVSGAPAEAG